MSVTRILCDKCGRALVHCSCEAWKVEEEDDKEEVPLFLGIEGKILVDRVSKLKGDK